MEGNSASIIKYLYKFMNKNLLTALFYVKLGLSRLTVDEKVTQGNAIFNSISGNLNFLVVTNPTLLQFQTAILNLSNSAFAYAANDGKNEKAAMLACEAIYDLMATQMGYYVQQIADLTPASSQEIILSAGMGVRKTRGKNPLPEALTLAIKPTDMTGTIKLKMTGGKYAKVFQVFMSTTEAPYVWQFIGLSQKRNYVVENIISGTHYNFKVVPNGTAGSGPESNVITQFAA